jgi:acyl phosphate:glycerol-3-phosphate acyltransferase
MFHNMFALLLFVIAYIVGSIPTGFLIARFKGIHDIRKYGSGTIGATNVARSLGRRYFFLILILDSLKAALLLYGLQWYGIVHELLMVAGVGLVVGNAYPLFLQFQGGKIVATSSGVFAVLYPLLLGYAFLIWALSLFWMRIVGVASIISFCSLPLFAYVCAYAKSEILFISGISCLGLWLHRKNMIELMRNSTYSLSVKKD